MHNINDVFEFHPCDTSEKLVVYFSSASARYLEGVRQLQNCAVNKLFVRDPHRNWYNGEIEGLCSDADSLKIAIESVVKKFKKENVKFIGSSMGGYGAILFGCLIGVSQVYAVAPQIVIDPCLPHSPKFKAKYSDLSEVIRNKDKDTTVNIWFGCGELFDIYQVVRCAGISKCKIHAIQQSLHNVLYHFKTKELHIIFLEALVMDKDFKYDYGSIKGIPYKNICEAVNAVYFEKNYAKSNSYLTGIEHPLCDGAIYCQIGLNCRNIRDYNMANEYLDKAVVCNPTNYEAYYVKGEIALAEKKYDKAVEYYSLAIKYFSGKNIEYFCHLSGAYRLKKDFQKALLYVNYAIDVNKEYPKTYYSAGLIYRDMGNYHDAIENFQKTLLLLPNFESAQRQLIYSISRYYMKDAKEKFGLDLTLDVALPPSMNPQEGKQHPAPEPETVAKAG